MCMKMFLLLGIRRGTLHPPINKFKTESKSLELECLHVTFDHCVACVARLTHRDHSVVLRRRPRRRRHTFNYYPQILLNHFMEFNETWTDFCL